MPCRQRRRPDWREPGGYQALLEAERPAFAWEWLRRRPDYRRAYRDHCQTTSGPAPDVDEPAAARWGLHRFESPDLCTPCARPLWRREVCRHILEVEAEAGGAPADMFTLERFADLTTWLRGAAGGEHLLLADGYRSIRIDIVRGTVAAGPVRLRYRLGGFAAAAEPLATLRRLVMLWRTGHFSPGLHPRDRRAARWIALLRAHDAIAAGATQREIAEHLLSRDASGRGWRLSSPSLRSRAQRLVRAAREMSASYGSLLE